jgi:PKD repeat protein
MSGTDPGGIRRTGSKAFVSNLNPDRDQAGVVSWDSGIDFSLPLTNDFAAVNANIDNVDDSGGTNLDVGFTEAIDLLDAGGRADANKVIIFLTDGGGSYTPSGAPGSQADRAAAAGYTIYTVGLGAGIDPTDLQEIANVTGGTYYFAATAEDILAIFDDIAGELICMDPLVVNFQAIPPMGGAPHTVQFRDTSSGQIETWTWTFGDGERSTSRYPSHTYQYEGTFRVCLTVTGPAGTATRCQDECVIVESAMRPAELVVRNLNISATYAQPRQEVRITADVANEGGSWGSDTVDLLINGAFEQSADVGVSPGTSQAISFTVYKIIAGEYQVQVGDATATFYVMEEPQETQRAGRLSLGTGGMIALIVIGVIVVGVVVFAIVRLT